MTNLGRFYLGYALAVGGPLLLLMIVATQAAHSSAEAMLAVALGLGDPLPMLLVGIAVHRGWKVAPFLAVALPMVLTAIVAQVVGHAEPPRSAGLLRSVVFNAAYGQVYFLPGAIVLGAIVVGRAVQGRRRSQPG